MSSGITNDRETEIKGLLFQAKRLAADYYRLTGKPIGVTGEVAEYEAAEKLNLKLAPPRTPFFDAFCNIDGYIERYQIKGRAVSINDPYRGRVPKIKCNGEFEAVLLVLLDKTTYETIEIWKADRIAVEQRLTEPGSKSRNERGSMGITQFKSIKGAKKIWPTTQTTQ